MVDHVRPKTLIAPTAAALRRNCARTGFPMPGHAWPFWSPTADGLVPDIVSGVDATQVTPVEGSWVTTRLGAALDVANTTSRSVDLPGTNAVQLAGAFTFTAYVTIDTASVSELLCGSDTSTLNYLFFATSTLFFLRAGGGASSVAHGGITPGAIMRLDATRDGDDLVTLYMDGHALGSFTMSGTFDIGRFGDRTSSNIPWYGKLIDIRICDGECASAAAIARDMALGMAVYQPPSDVVALVPGALGGGSTTTISPAHAEFDLEADAPALTTRARPGATAVDLSALAPKITTLVSPAFAELDAGGLPPHLVELLRPGAAELDLGAQAPGLTTVTRPGYADLVLDATSPRRVVRVYPAYAEFDLSGFAPRLVERVRPTAAELVLHAFGPDLPSTSVPLGAPEAIAVVGGGTFARAGGQFAAVGGGSYARRAEL